MCVFLSVCLCVYACVYACVCVTCRVRGGVAKEASGYQHAVQLANCGVKPARHGE